MVLERSTLLMAVWIVRWEPIRIFSTTTRPCVKPAQAQVCVLYFTAVHSSGSRNLVDGAKKHLNINRLASFGSRPWSLLDPLLCHCTDSNLAAIFWKRQCTLDNDCKNSGFPPLPLSYDDKIGFQGKFIWFMT